MYGYTQINDEIANQAEALCKTLASNKHKALDSLLENAQDAFHRYGKEAASGPRDGLTALVAINSWLHHCYGLASAALRPAYSNGPDFKFQNRKDRELFQQAKRFLNLAAQIVSYLEKSSGTTRNQAEIEYALDICHRMVNLLRPQHPFQHPDAPKWYRLQSKCKRRLVDLWMQSARDDDSKAHELETPTQAIHRPHMG